MENLTYKIEKKPNCAKELNIEAAWGRVNEELEKIYINISKEISIPGFRKGKVPVNVIKERYKNEAKQELVSKFSPILLAEVLEKEKINPVTTPQIVDYKLEHNKPFTLKVKVEVYPEVQLKKYKKIKLDKKNYVVKEKDVENTIKSFGERNAVLKVKDGKAAKNNYVVVNMKVFMDSQEINAGFPPEMIFEIGGNTTLPGFDENLKGVKKDDDKEFEYQFPEDFAQEDLKGKKALFKIKVIEVKEKKVPAKKEIAQSLGFDSVEKLSENIRKNLNEQMERTAANEMEDQIIEYLVEKHEFEVPEGLIEESLQKHKKQMENYIKSQGGDVSQMDGSKMKERVTKEIKAGIVLSTIAEEEGIKVNDDDRKAEEDKMVKMFGEDTEKTREQARKYVNDNVILTRKVFDMIKENAKIKVQEVKKTGADIDG